MEYAYILCIVVLSEQHEHKQEKWVQIGKKLAQLNKIHIKYFLSNFENNFFLKFPTTDCTGQYFANYLENKKIQEY